MKRWLLAAPAFLGAGCGSASGDSTIDVVYDPCVARPDTSLATDAEAAATLRALELWQPAIGEATLAWTSTWIAIEFQSAAPMFRGVYDDERGIVFINRDLDPDGLTFTIAHELGHAFGLPHVPRSERTSVMNQGKVTVPPSTRDLEMLRASWGTCAALDAPAIE